MGIVQNHLIDQLIAICGDKYVIADTESMTPYLTDWRGHYHGKAQAVVHPASTEDVQKIIRLANEHLIPIVPQGGNTSLCGGATPDDKGKAVVLAMGRMNTIRHLDSLSQTITVDGGCILEHIQQAAKQRGLVFPLDFGSRGSCQIGGALSTNAGGLNVVRYGNARQLCLGLEVVTAQGEVMNLLSALKKDNTGYDLRDVFIGAEGTLGVITGAVLQLFPEIKSHATAWAGVHDINGAIDLLHRAQRASGGGVIAFELMAKTIVDNVCSHYPDAKPPLKPMPEFSCLVEIASTAEGDSGLRTIMENLLNEAMLADVVVDATIAQNEHQRQGLWMLRELTPESEIKAGPAYKSDISIPHEHMNTFYQEAVLEVKKISTDIKIFSFGHIGDGNLHFNLATEENKKEGFPALYPQFDEILLRLLKKYNGSISAEHGIGQKKRDMLTRIKDPAALALMTTLKAALDPKGIMNPNKVIATPNNEAKP